MLDRKTGQVGTARWKSQSIPVNTILISGLVGGKIAESSREWRKMDGVSVGDTSRDNELD